MERVAVHGYFCEQALEISNSTLIVCCSSSCWPSTNQRLPYSQKTVTSHNDTDIDSSDDC